MRLIWQVWKIATAMTVFTSSVVAVTIMLLYPRELWLWELSLSLTLTVTLTYPLVTYMAIQQRRIADLRDELEGLLARDRLTGLASRDHFFAVVEVDPGASGVVLMIDIDHFKQINDTYGHLAGDTVIAGVAGILERATRPEDIVCRFGGEEFLAFLFAATVEEGARIAERMRMAVKAAAFEWEGVVFEVQVSVGAALCKATPEIDAAISAADQALYRAKRGGRNRVDLAWRVETETAVA